MSDAAELSSRKEDAEIVKLYAEAEAARELARFNSAQAAKAEAEQRKADAEAGVIAINLDRERRKEAREMAGDVHHHTYRFTGAVAEGTVKSCMEQLAVWMRNDPGCAIEIIFTSPGGSVIEGMALWDYIQMVRDHGHTVTTATLGLAASMAGILLQAGDIRVMGKQSWLMIHEASFGAQGKIGEVEDTVEWVKMVQERILDIFAARSKMTRRQIKTKWTRKDWWLSSDEALKLGFVDEVR